MAEIIFKKTGPAKIFSGRYLYFINLLSRQNILRFIGGKHGHPLYMRARFKMKAALF